MFRIVQEKRLDALKSQRPILSCNILVRKHDIVELPTCVTLSYSGDDLDLHSASEDEESAEVDDEASDAGSYQNSDTEQPVISRTLMVFSKSKEVTPDGGGIMAVMDDSETESESDAEPVAQTLKRKTPSFPQVVPPSKRKQAPPAEGMS